MELNQILLEASSGSGVQNQENVPIYCSDETEVEVEPSAKKKRSKGREYIFVKNLQMLTKPRLFCKLKIRGR